MPLWHVEFAIVPRRALISRPPVALAQLFETDWWRSAALPSAFERQLESIAPPAPAASRAATVQTWGEEDGNRVDVWFENGRATRMFAHVDVRRLDARFGAMLLQFARIADAVLVRRDGLVIEPTAGAFGAALRSSEAWSFANDPAAFISAYVEPDDEE